MIEIIVADAGPLIAFARLEKLHMLPQLFSRVLVPEEVIQECTCKTNTPEGPLILQALEEKFLVRSEVIAGPDADYGLGPGETSAIALALHQQAGLMLDDRAARRMAQQLGIRVLGSAGVLVLAKRKGLLLSVKPLLHHLQDSGYFLSQELIAATLALCEES